MKFSILAESQIRAVILPLLEVVSFSKMIVEHRIKPKRSGKINDFPGSLMSAIRKSDVAVRLYVDIIPFG